LGRRNPAPKLIDSSFFRVYTPPSKPPAIGDLEDLPMGPAGPVAKMLLFREKVKIRGRGPSGLLAPQLQSNYRHPAGSAAPEACNGFVPACRHDFVNAAPATDWRSPQLLARRTLAALFRIYPAEQFFRTALPAHCSQAFIAIARNHRHGSTRLRIHPADRTRTYLLQYGERASTVDASDSRARTTGPDQRLSVGPAV
jgi:hypothetical protein